MRDYERNFIKEKNISTKEELIDFLSQDIEGIDFEAKTYNALKRNGIDSAYQVLQIKQEDDVLPRCGRVVKKLTFLDGTRLRTITDSSIRAISTFVGHCSMVDEDVHFGMTDEELVSFGFNIKKIKDEKIDKGLYMQFGEAFRIISENPDAKLRLASCLEGFVKQESELAEKKSLNK